MHMTNLFFLHEEDLRVLCTTLWSWRLCTACQAGLKCSEETCPTRRWRRLSHFLRYYQTLLRIYEADHPTERSPKDVHDLLISIVDALKMNPKLTRGELVIQRFSTSSSQIGQVRQSQQRIVDLAVKIMTTITCSSPDQRPWENVEDGLSTKLWSEHESFSDYVEGCFDVQGASRRSLDVEDNIEIVKRGVRAKILRKRAGVRFVPTDDIRHHLRFDRNSNSVEIFPHIAWLKEHLILTRGSPLQSSFSGCLHRGALPRQLVLEVLDTIQMVVFPKSDRRSRKILESWVAVSKFDPDCMNLDFDETRNPDERYIKYHFFGGRLLELFEETQNPHPQSTFDKWLERRSRARHVTLITLAGVMTAVLLGVAALIVSVFQAWVSWQAWKHPVQANQELQARSDLRLVVRV